MSALVLMTHAEPRPQKARRTATDDLAPIARAAIEGRADATRTLVVSVTPAVLRAVRGVIGTSHPDVEDTAQEAIFRFIKALPTFRHECSVTHFACRIAALTALNVRRAARSRGEGRTESLDPERHLSTDRSPIEELAASARREALRELFVTLPVAQAEALIMHLVLGLTIEETAEACGAPPNTIRSRLRLAKQAVRMRVSSDPMLADALGRST